ncbi:diaminobutyrate--2-oxoglutarate transaminase family protein [Blastococcus capsensis]|uniref:diaminobutyrate--2-oxoglutarate transaminase family protein n=1 Tax=Blastococcus capsensis TaxID=1564163 RepID=UPI00254263C0|nr:diaminobutyrate--2-oxoglutarate transaminase family protein [Blastococcus capsensis]MDK3256675.1 diaminobutyrate--2-oxoglutarate transaminase family protein [Blastococcus capsensis]
MSLAIDRTAPPEPSGVLARQAARESAARTYARNLRIVPVHAQGMTVTGADGRRYLDCLSGAGTLALGHNHPVVVEAVQQVIQRGAPWHALDIATPEKDEFTDALFAALPPGLARRAKVHFCGPAGTDAVEAALKLARTATGRIGVAAFTGGYHGMTAGALAASGGVAVKEPMAGVAAEATRLPYPYAYRCPFGLGDASGEVSARYVERLLDDPNGGVVPPAAMIVEAVQGEGGVIPAPLPWLREMRRITAERGIPLIADEVQTGVGRTGTMWAFEAADVEPDVMVLSKAIGGSLPLAVVVYADHLDSWAPGAHTGTFRGTTLAMAAGAATLRYVRAERLPERAEALGRRLRAELEGLAKIHPSIGQVRGRGLMIGIELVEPDAAPDRTGARPAAPALAAAVRTECLRRGLIVELGGRHDSVVRLLPPLVMTDEEAGQVLDRLDAALAEAGRGHRA